MVGILHETKTFSHPFRAAFQRCSASRVVGRLCAAVLSLLAGCGAEQPLLDRVQDEGALVVITRNSPTTYYEERDGFRGLEYELVERFANRLGVQVRYIVPESFDQIIPMIVNGEAHFAAAGLTVTPKRETLVRFAPSYQEITQQLVYRRDRKKPKSIADTLSGTLEVVAGSSHEETLERLKLDYPELTWTAQQGIESEELLYLVKEQLINYTIGDSNEVALSRQLYPMLKVAMDLGEPDRLAWAFPHAEDDSLYDAASEFIGQLKSEGILEQLLERYYGHMDRLGFVDKRTFQCHFVQRLPDLLAYFREAARQTGLDWRLLAAVSYQESHWNTKAVSPTGVRGLMMLTRATANQLGVDNRRDPKQSILGGARYIRMMQEKIPERIQEPDRMWLTLASYNIGFSHLEDARILAMRDGADPDKWTDVKRYLPLLSQKKHHKTVKYGYARGAEAVNYVDNIRNYFDLLTWHLAQRPENQGPKKPIEVNLPPML